MRKESVKLYKMANSRLSIFFKPEFTVVNEDLKNESNAEVAVLYGFTTFCRA